jgi:hypothetical protein
MSSHRKEKFMRAKLASSYAILGLLAGVVPSGLVGGCGAQPDASTTSEAPREEIGRVSSALTYGTQIGQYTDGSGAITLRVYVCPYTAVAEVNQTDCTIPDSDFAIVGGGADIYPLDSSQPGALLTASYPLGAYNTPYSGMVDTWRAASKDHYYYYPHQLRAYVIGMRLAGVSNLRSMTHIDETSSNNFGSSDVYKCAGRYFNNQATFPGDQMVGGGAYTTYTGAGELLVNSGPYFNDFVQGGTQGCWAAWSKDHIVADPSGTIHPTVIAMPRCPTGFGGCLGHGLFNLNGAGGTGYRGAQVGATNGGWATTSIGAKAHSNPLVYGRLLTHLLPWSGGAGGATIWTKDHGFAEYGWGEALAYVLRKE